MNIVFSHCTQSYPLQFSASNTKADFLARGLAEAGATITFVNSVLGSDVCQDSCLKHHNIRCYLFAKRYKFLVRLIINIPKLIRILNREYIKGDINVLFIGGEFPICLVQMLCAKLIGYKLALLTQEWAPALNPQGIIRKIDCELSTKCYGKWLDMIFPISHFLLEKNEHFKKPMHIIPILSDFNVLLPNINEEYGHFAYCAGAAYFRVLKMLLNAYKVFVERGGNQKLILILYGREDAMKKAKEAIAALQLNGMIEVKQQISDKELQFIYRTSLGLLIPLDPYSVQDEARFSQKIAEYLATKRPIITCNVGEIPYYFTDKHDAMIVDYTAESFANAMAYLAKHENEATQIGLGGYMTGKKYFDYCTNGKKVFDFIKQHTDI